MSAPAVRQLERVFSGIQPSGIPHLGNYFGALTQWVKLAVDRTLPCPGISQGQAADQPPARCDTPIFCIVDVHAYRSSNVQLGPQLYQNILDTTASLLAIGLSPDNCVLFRQSDVLEHNYLDNALHNFVTTQRLTKMTQYKDKSASVSSKAGGIPNGLLTYPVLQAADILLYRAGRVPVGEDQTQHIELARDIARSFNSATASSLFVEPKALLNESKHARRVKSLRDPAKKMSKSDQDKRSFVQIVDEPDVLLEKIKKAKTDCISEVYYDAEARPGVSNLLRIHHLVTGDSFDAIRDQSASLTSAQYKLALADLLIEKFRPAREEYKRVRGQRAYLESVLQLGHDRAKPMASATVAQVKRLLGSTCA